MPDPQADHQSTTQTPPPLTPEQAAEAADRFKQDFAALRAQIAKAVVGNDQVIEQTLIALFASGHVLLEGVPGIGKTLLVRTIAQALRLDFGRVQFTPDLMPADITGTTVVDEIEDPATNQRSRQFRFQSGPVFCNLLLADEINRATPKTQSALLEAMQERSVTAAGTTHTLPNPFFVLATQNPVEQEGTYPLPEAQLDRFFFKVLVGSPTRDDLTRILALTTTAAAPDITPVLDATELLAHQQLVRQVAAAPHVSDYAVRLVLATHPTTRDFTSDYATPMVNQYVRLGASPRAAQSLILAAKCRALAEGRPAASPDDIRAVAPAALRHRIIINFEAEAEGLTHDRVVDNLIETLPVTTN